HRVRMCFSNPVSRMYYGFSTMICTPVSLSQEVGLALGAQAGERRLREDLSEGGSTRFRRAAETPFNMSLEARPWGNLSRADGCTKNRVKPFVMTQQIKRPR